jgi:acetyltransferase EpsM
MEPITPQPVVIYGAGGLGLMVRDILSASANHRAVAFLDSDQQRHGQMIDGLPVRGGLEAFASLLADGVSHVVVAIGDSQARLQVAETIQRHGGRLVSAIHPLAMIAPNAELGKHLIIGARATLCVHARVGDHCVISPGSIVEHDNELGQGVMLEPAVRLAGGVRIDQRARVGIGASVIPGRRIGRCATVAPGSVVIRDVPPGALVSGAPAQVELPEQSRFVTQQAQWSPAKRMVGTWS